ncbi:MAG: hypothetical protein UY63_C0004G0059 [Parcubacteria group bacterium GW2011_GWA2_51_10]|nr:MAG: hypothetical protein UY63_C0004G0059 [Parcubacteria group bacterium GW2011_GWA2_51_10]
MDKSENQNRGLGGDGGKVFIFAKEIKGSGKILADGGDGFTGGKGGEVHIVTEKNDYTGEVSAKGGKSDDVRPTGKIDWQKRAVIVAVIIFVFGLIADYFLQKPSVQQEGTINTVDQIGDNIVNNPPLPKPKLTYNVVEPINQLLGRNQYQTKYEATISSEFPIPTTIGISFPSFCSGKGLGGGPWINGGITLNQIRFEIICITESPILKDQLSFSLVDSQR